MAAKKNIIVSKTTIISQYSDYCLMNGKRPDSVYKFAKENGFEESQFYQFFSSFEALEHQYFAEMFNHTLETLEASPAYTEYSGTEKLSAFYFTFYELATANRSFVMFLFEEGGSKLRNIVKLKELRREFIKYAEAILEKPLNLNGHKAEKLQDNALREGAWIQFLIIFKFWMQDTSPGFEKTDIFIEKSVKASSDLVYNTPLKSLLDLGKFIWKEKFTA
jgi:AcrR family transcriptional regulator